MSIPEAVIDAASAPEDDGQLGSISAKARARRVILALAAGLPESAVEKAARVLCVEDGQRDPDELDAMFICDANNRALPAWRWYEDQARAAIIAALKEVGGEKDGE